MILKKIFRPYSLLVLLVILIYYQFFFFQKIPVPADTLSGAYFPWLDYNFGYPAGVPVKNPLISDVFSQFFLWKYLAVDIIRMGEWPLWNPYSFSGTPLLATYHSAVFSPFNLLLFLPRYFGWGLFIFGQTLTASLGMYLLSGLFTKRVFARLAASLVFSLSGLMSTWAEFGTGVYAASMLPWIFYFLERYFVSKNFKFLIFMTISFTALYLAGHAQLTFYSTTLFLIYLFFKIKDNFRQKLNYLPIIFWLLSLGLFSIQLLPTLELADLSIRAGEAYSKSFNFGLNPPYELIRLISADFFGNPATYNHWDNQSYHEQSSFLGTLTLPLILPLFVKRFRTKHINFWLWVFISSIFLSIDNPVTSWLYSLPLPFLTYSSASRIFFLTSFSAGILISVALDKFTQDDTYRFFTNRSGLYTLVVLVGILGGLAGVFYYLSVENGSNINGSLINNLKVSLKNSLLPIFFLASLIVISQKIFKRKIFVILIVLLIYFDLGRYFLKYNPFVDQKLIFPQTPVISYLQSRPGPFRVARADPEVLPPNTWSFFKLESIEGYDPLAYDHYGHFFNRVNNLDYLMGVSRYMELKDYPSKFLDALNTKYLLSVKRDESGHTKGDYLNKRLQKAGYKIAFEDKNTVVLENPHAKNRAYFVKSLINARNQDELVAKLNDSNYDPSKEAVIREDGTFPEISNDGWMSYKSINPNEILLTTDSKGAGFIVLAQSFDKGWQVFEDGKNIISYKVDGALTGILVSGGKHDIRLVYWPKSFDLGLKVTIVSLLTLPLLSGFLLKRARLSGMLKMK